MKTSVFLATLALGSSNAFTVPRTQVSNRSTSLQMAKNDGAEKGKTLAASVLAAAYVLTGVVSVDAASAFDGTPDFAGSSTVISARSGGRTGGRAAPKQAPPPTKVINKSTTVIQSSPAVVAAPPVVMGSPYGYGGYYDPTPGLALNLGLSAVSAVGNGMREYRQTEEIARSRAELSAAKDREADMSERIRALEQMQMRGNQPPPGYYAPPPQYAQPPMQPAAAP